MANIIKTYYEDRKSPFKVKWTVDGKRWSRFFTTEKEREDFITELNKIECAGETELLKLSPARRFEMLSLLKMIPEDIPLTEIGRFWNKHHKATEVKKLWDCADEYIRTLNMNKDKCPSYVNHARRIMELLCRDFSDTLVTEITRQTLEKWLANLPYGAVTKKNYKSTIRAAWGFFERNDWIDKNVADKVLGDITVMPTTTTSLTYTIIVKG